MDKLPESIHFTGIGGIGMSGLAQMAAALKINVTGSDRAYQSPENRRIIKPLEKQGIRLYPQDGSRFGETELPGAIVYSTAIENDNPDFKAGGDIPHLHRSEALKLLAERSGESLFAVTGSCGKTSVSAWLGEALDRIGASPSLLCGGLAKHFIRGDFAGNYCRGAGGVCVMEADESDKSLLNYSADHAMVLNIGTDHYSKEELARVFGQFLKQTRKTAILEDHVLKTLGKDAVSHLNVLAFSVDPESPEELFGIKVLRVRNYRASSEGVFAEIDGGTMRIPVPGLHNAANAAAVLGALLLLGYSKDSAMSAVESFSGVWRRFDFAGKNRNGVSIYDDYAHNVEKLVSCISAAREVAAGKVGIFFQPHGFGPLKFMRPELYRALESVLRENDIFAFLPVYYAGGTAAFTPTSEEVCAEYASKDPARFRYFANRAEAEAYLAANFAEGDVAVTAGARDNSISDWASALAGKRS